MEKDLNQPGMAADNEVSVESGLGKEREMKLVENPLVVCCVTMGKEPHLGHLLLLAIAEQMNRGLGSKLPIMLINNNTGPRAAGALVTMAETEGLDLSKIAWEMSKAQYPAERVVEAYRKRSQDASKLSLANREIQEKGVDIFARVAQETEESLAKAGYEVRVVSEVELQRQAVTKMGEINQIWAGSGFLPFVHERRVVALEKGGELTAVGALLASTKTLSETTAADLTLVVDSQTDASEVAFVQTKMEGKTMGVQVNGAGAGFGGKIASGTKGEAMTIKDVAAMFERYRPVGKLRQAAVFLTLTQPLNLGDKQQLLNSFYNFESNEEAVRKLVESCDAAELLVQSTINDLEVLSQKVEAAVVDTDKVVLKFKEYLKQKTETLLAGEPSRVLSESKKIVNGVRQNYYLNYLQNLRKTMGKINSLTMDEWLMVGKMVEYCLKRLGL